MESSKTTASSKKKGKTKLTWRDRDTDVEVIFDPQYSGSDHTVRWATVLERLALKKSSNVKIFEEIQKTLKKEFQTRKMEVKELTSAAILCSFLGSTPKHQKIFVKIRLRIYTLTNYLSDG